MNTSCRRLAACFVATALVCVAVASPAFAIFPIIVPQVNPEIIIDPQEPPNPGDIPPIPEIPTTPCDCDCEPHINNTPEPATLVSAIVGSAILGGIALRKRWKK